ncbi:MAG: hypothetical protein ACREA2_00810 [Blastocatellia bacterium]
MKKPIPIIILSAIGAMNGAGAIALGAMALLGAKVVFTPSGYGPNRIAIAQWSGPFANQSGWFLIGIGFLILSVSYGLFTLQEWMRLTVFWVLAVSATLTVVAIGWGIYESHWGVVTAGLLKVAVESALCWYLNSSRVRRAFAGHS